MRVLIKIGAAVLAFVPMLVVLLTSTFNGVLPESIAKPICFGCVVFNFPAFSIFALIKTYQISKDSEFLSLVFCLLAWSSFMGWLFWKIAETFLGEDEPEFESNPERAKFDWKGFQVRFVLGFAIGFLFGWRFVRYSTNNTIILITMVVTGLVVGLAYGLYRPNFWGRS